MSNIDEQLLSLLRQNARESVATLARRLAVSRGTITNRLRKLEDEGVIAGYTVRLRAGHEIGELRAWMGLAIDGNETPRITDALLNERSVRGLHATNGRWDLLAELQVANLQELVPALERIRLIPGIRQAETSIHLQTLRATPEETYDID